MINLSISSRNCEAREKKLGFTVYAFRSPNFPRKSYSLALRKSSHAHGFKQSLSRFRTFLFFLNYMREVFLKLYARGSGQFFLYRRSDTVVNLINASDNSWITRSIYCLQSFSICSCCLGPHTLSLISSHL